MIAVVKFHELTLKLIQVLESCDKDRNEKITQVKGLLELRDALIKEINPPYSTEAVELGNKINQLNTKLSILLQAEKTFIQKDIKELQTKKETNNKYINPYQSLSTDGMFYDKRK